MYNQNGQRNVVPGWAEQDESERRDVYYNSLSDEEKRKLRKEDDARKALLLQKEFENYTRIYVMRCADGWLKIYDHSAVILAKYLDGRLRRHYVMKAEGDNIYGTKASYGAVSVHPSQVANFVQTLLDAKLKMLGQNESEMEFELGERIDKETIVKLLHEDELAIAQTNKIVMPNEIIPAVRAAAKIFLVDVHSHIRAQRDMEKDVFLNDAERTAVGINRRVVLISRGALKFEKGMTEMGILIEEMYANLTTMSDMSLITARQYRDLVNELSKIRDEIGREKARRKVAKKEKEKEEEAKNAGTDRVEGGEAGEATEAK